ncbi:hypothetical protein N8T08_010186 [Aspergillus melleus]|uniref:Uncharacterized protein n=1 Tax=Aspergillus melleus TaxID=138277 RepID=A0ACC3BCH5_9EURO|nr:hypothetical protein N8T08_010186 [Aspergillus melleus]
MDLPDEDEEIYLEFGPDLHHRLDQTIEWNVLHYKGSRRFRSRRHTKLCIQAMDPKDLEHLESFINMHLKLDLEVQRLAAFIHKRRTMEASINKYSKSQLLKDEVKAEVDVVQKQLKKLEIETQPAREVIYNTSCSIFLGLAEFPAGRLKERLEEPHADNNWMNQTQYGNITTATITQKYTNPSSSPVAHAKYLFPIYDGSAVTSFKCWIGEDKLLEGAVKPKQQARKEFAEAVSKHKAAVLVEELTPEIFETNLGSIPSQTDVAVEITLATQLRGDQTTGATTLTIPTSVAPRYGLQPRGYAQPETASTIAVAGEDALHINVHVSMPEQITQIESQTHTISVKLGSETGIFDPCKANTSLTGRSAFLEKDFVLTILSSSKEWMVSRAIAVAQPNSHKSTIALMLSPGDLFRKRFNPDNYTGEVIFVADRSSSMNAKIPALRNAMHVFLRSLPEKCSFNIVSFGTSFSWMWESSQPYSQEILDEATSHVGSFEANFGGTKILQALESIPEHFNKRADVPTNVIVLTDGETWDVENVIKFVARTASNPETNIRFFALGIGKEVSHRLVQGIGMRGGGYAEVISDTNSSLVWQGKMIQMLKNALTPSRLRCSINFDGLMQDATGCLQAPHSVPSLSSFSHQSIYYMLDRDVGKVPDTVTITATTEDGMNLTAQLLIHRSNTHSIHHLAAKAFINDYETGQSWFHAEHASLLASDQGAFNRILEHEAQKLGVRWSIPSRWTSYVAVERISQEGHETSLEPAERGEPPQDSESESDEDMGFGLYDGGSTGGVLRFCRAGSSSSSDDGTAAHVARRLPDLSLHKTRGIQGGTAEPIKEPTQPELNLSRVLYLQAANGDMRVEGSAIEAQLLAEFQPQVTEDMSKFLASMSVKLETMERAFLLNILAVIYVTVRCVESKGLWEMQITKARRFLKKRLEAAGGIDTEAALEQLGSMAQQELVH